MTWLRLASDLIVGALAGYAAGCQLVQNRINRSLVKAIFEHMGGDVITVATAIYDLNPAVGEKLIKALIAKAQERAK